MPERPLYPDDGDEDPEYLHIYLARRAGLDRLVAVKVLSGPRANDPEAAALFRDEARLVGMLSHANLASVHEAWAMRSTCAPTSSRSASCCTS